MSSSIVVSPISASTISPTNNNNNNNGNNHKINNSNSGNQKSETQYGGNASSPCNSDGNSSQTVEDCNANNKNKTHKSNGVNLNNLDNSSRGERDSLSNISTNSLMRQGSGTGTNNCLQKYNETSPNNGDSSSSSSNVSHLNNDSCKQNDEETLNKNQTIKSSIKKEDRDNSNSILCTSSSSSANSSNNTPLTTQAAISSLKVALASSAIVKDEKDLIKKEETSLSPPNMSPVGFGSFVGGTQNNECNDNTVSNANKLNDSSSSCDKRSGGLSGNVFNENEDAPVAQSASGLLVPGPNLNLSGCNTLNTNTNPLNSKSSLDGFCSDGSTSTPIGSNTTNTTCNITLNASFISNNLTNNNGPQQGGGGSNLISGGGNGVSNCMEYMQQQNHIFVFSTQLANKGAEAVLGGQFPTIIAYHCTQPATKSFFEDFFLKNPMKMPKLQRQNTLNIMGGMQPGGGEPGAGGQPPWLTNIFNPMGKMPHKLALNKSETITSSSTSGSGINENDMINWEQTRNAIEGGGPTGDSSNAMKILENVDSANNSSNKAACPGLSNDDISGIPSLQGVKVPDENLTPQQRQHREEQLAKLKKMNQFLFPENGGANDFLPPNNNSMIVGKMQIPPEVLSGSGMSANQVAMMNMQSPGLGNKLNPAAMRNISGSLLNHSKSGSNNSQHENITSLGEDVSMPADMMSGSGCGANDMGIIPAHKQGCLQNINNPGGSMGGCVRGLINTGGNNLSVMGNSGMASGGSSINDANNAMMGNSPDVLSPFNSNHCPSTGQESNVILGSHKNMNAPPQPDINPSVGMPQLEWSKVHHHIYEERLKNHHTNISPDIGVGSIGCQQTPSLTRSNSTGIGGGGSMSLRTNTNLSSSNRSNQGPPPPYHPTQRSASVPIATQSPNPSSPNNPTSNMSLPSPRASNTLSGLSLTTSPNSHMDVASSSSSSTNTTLTTTTTVSVGGTSSSNVSANKFIYTQEDSPTPASGSSNSARNRSNVNNLNSNPTTPLSHVSPKDIDSMNLNTTPNTVPEHKSTRPSPQRSRSPLLNDIPTNNMEARYPSPALNFPSGGGMTGGNSQNLANNFKSQNSNLERSNLQQIPFCRRTDNMPLNPNSNRSNQNKMSNTFDPISSLAQMSQQLTGCGVGFNSAGVGNSPNNMSGLMGEPGVNDMNMDAMMSGPVMGPGDPLIDHCNQNPNGGNMGMSGLGGPGVPVSFGPGNCNMLGGNAGPICQRLLNPKMCGPNIPAGFNPNHVGGGGMRENPAGFPGIMPSHRMMNHRMSANFGNFNVSPNIQVKASTPNTIQYMPVRPQNNNNNMRVPPSLEFLQRYANPQMMGNSVGGPGPGPGSINSDMASANAPSDLNKMPNTNNMGLNPNAMNQMNFYGSCNRMSTMSGMGQTLGGEQDELQGMMSNHDPMNIPGPHAPMLRGMRPIRQSGLQPGINVNTGSRMQHPGMSNNIPHPNNLGGNIFPGNDNETLGYNNPSNANMFNNPAASGLYQQQKNNKPPTMGGINHGPANININNSNNGPLSNINLINDQNPSSNSMQNSVMIGGPNNSMLNSNIPGGGNAGPDNMGYKPFVGPASNDLKYAQQYHSFQQQLYATSTRNQQQPVGGQQQSSNAMSPNSNPNAGFFVNK